MNSSKVNSLGGGLGLQNLLASVIYAFLWVLGLFVFYAPSVLKDFFTNLASHFVFHFLPFRRKIILHNLSICFPRAKQESMADFERRCKRIARKNYQHYLLVILEILERFHWNKDTIAKRVVSRNFEYLFDLQKKGQGYFFLTAHLGNWELLTFYGVLRGLPLTIITRYLRSGLWDTIWVKSRRDFGLELLNESGSGIAIIKSIRRDHRAVGFIMDQHTGLPHGILHQFFGVPAWCPKGLAILSTKLSCPVIPAYMIRQSAGHFEVVIEDPLQFPANEEQNTDDRVLAEHIGICNRNMEKWISRYPEQYLWLHKRFKSTFDYSQPLAWES